MKYSFSADTDSKVVVVQCWVKYWQRAVQGGVSAARQTNHLLKSCWSVSLKALSALNYVRRLDLVVSACGST